MSSGTIYNESKLSECQAVQFTMKVNKLQFNESKLFECQAVQFTMKINFLNVKRYNLQWK